MSNDHRNGPVKRIIPGVKDSSGAYTPEVKDLSIDGLLKQGLETIHGIMRGCLAESKSGVPSRESVQNLKDCMSMLQALKEKEQEILDELTDDELLEAAKGAT